MAFNPFHSFRKHQKVIFAVLTIICMFVFILQFGKGDVTSWFMSGSQGKGEKVVALYGRDLYADDVTAIMKSRQLANEFIAVALNVAQTDANKDLTDYKPDNPDQADLTLQQLAADRFNLSRDVRSPEALVQKTRQHLAAIDALRNLSAPASNPRRERALDDLTLIYKIEFFTLTQSASPFYFGGGVKTQDYLDFEIWKHQAEKLGIVLTKADTRRAVAHEAANHGLPTDPGGSWAAEPAFKEWFSGKARRNGAAVPEDILVKAVEDEFRVMIAKELVAGHAAGIPGIAEVEHNTPDLVTPYDFWKFYRNNRTTIKVAILPIPVESFLDKTPAQPPSEQELKDLYAKFKGVEPNPELSTPGFKEPHRIKIEYITASPESEYYKARGLAAVLDPVLFYATSSLGAHLAGSGVAPQAVLADVADKDTLASQYNYYLGSGSDWVAPTGKIHLSNTQDQFGLREVSDLHDQTYQRPEVIAAAVGQAFGASLSGSSPLTAPTETLSTVFAREAEDRARILASTFLEAAGWSINSSPFAGFALQAPFVPAMPPASVAMRRLFEERQQQVLKDGPRFFPGQPANPGLVSRNLQEFTEELAKIKNKPDAEIQDFIKKTAKERGWEIHDKAGLDDAYAIADDSALHDVKSAIEDFQRSQSRDQQPMLPPFAKVVFEDFPAGKYIPSLPLPDGMDKTMVFWRSEDERARELSYDDARPRVLAAWRLLEARKLALAAADRINEELSQGETSGKMSPPEAIKFFRDQKLGEVFELADVARLIPGPTVNPLTTAYYPYVIPASKIPYAPADLLDQFMALEKPGQSIVFSDLPEKKWYVAVLEERPILSFDDGSKDKAFMELYRDATNSQKDQFWSQYFLGERRREFEEKLMRQLREEAGKVDDKGQLVLTGKMKQGQQQQNAPDNGGGDDGF